MISNEEYDFVDAERAEYKAEVIRLRAELAEAYEVQGREAQLRAALALAEDYGLFQLEGKHKYLDERDAARAAIARIRELCDNPPVPSRMLIPLIRAALERNPE